jgi:hypothetical protein
VRRQLKKFGNHWSRQCGILNISQPHRPLRPFTGIALLLLFYFTKAYIRNGETARRISKDVTQSGVMYSSTQAMHTAYDITSKSTRISRTLTLCENSRHFEINRKEVNPSCAGMKRIPRTIYPTHILFAEMKTGQKSSRLMRPHTDTATLCDMRLRLEIFYLIYS